MLDPKSLQAFARTPEIDDAAEAGSPETEATTEGEDRLQFLRPMVEMFAAEYADMWADIPADVMDDPAVPLDQLSRDVLTDQLADFLDEQFVVALQTVPDLSFEEATELAAQTESEGLVDDAPGLAMWLFRLAGLLAEEADAPTLEDDVVEGSAMEG
jgi:hypothetical protein